MVVTGCAASDPHDEAQPTQPTQRMQQSGAGAASGSGGDEAREGNGGGSGGAASFVPDTADADAAIEAPAMHDADGGATASVDAGSRSGCASAVVCDSFEDGDGAALDESAWHIASVNCSGTGEVDIDETLAHSGTRSVRVRGGGGYCNHVFFTPSLSAPLPDPLFGRFFVRMQTALGAGHVTFFAIHDTSEDKDLRMGGQSEILMWNRESDDATLPELSPTGIAASLKPAAQTWLCVEFELAGQAGELRTFVDGEAVVGLAVEGEATPDIDSQWKRNTGWRPRAGDARFGWESYGDQANTLWFDDIALSSTRIGCSP